MPQSNLLLSSLKVLLKSNGITYNNIAVSLGLSEASIKRLFSEKNFSLQRLDHICQLMDLEISDLVKYMELQQQQVIELTEEQENEITSDVKLLLVTFLVINGWKFENIIERYDLTEFEVVQYLAKLDKIKLIELLPKNRIRLRISSKFTWRQNGPIQRFFTKNLQSDFLACNFEDTQETYKFPSGMLSKSSCEQLNRRINQLFHEFHRLNDLDRDLPLTDRFGYSMLIAFRQWRPDVFEKILRK